MGRSPTSRLSAGGKWGRKLPAQRGRTESPRIRLSIFSVDFDATDSEIINAVIPYFQAIPEGLSRMGRTYRIGVYAPRRVCHLLTNAGLVVSSFVSDMSAGYGSNKAQILPENWAFDQIQTKFEGSGSGLVEIDKNIVSGRYSGINTFAPAWGVGDDPEIDWRGNPDAWDAMFEEAYRDTYEHEGAIQQAYNAANKENVKGNVLALDPYITGSSDIRWGSWGESAGGEEHAEPVVVPVAVAA
ncbi:glycoside hydrolase domain-containing protein, partial [Microbacterium sp. NPDC003461]